MGNYSFTVSLFILIFLITVAITISATDVILQALSTASTASGTLEYNSLVVVVGVSYALLVIITLSITCGRFLENRRMLRGIAKSHTPTSKIPKEVADKVQHGLLMATRILQAIKPLSSDINHPGWANPDTVAFKGVDLKRAVTRTPIIIENTATSISDTYTRPTFVDIRQYISFLIRQGIVDKRIGLVYLDGYEKARFSKHGPTEEEYMFIMHHLAAMLNQMGYHLHQKISTQFIGNISQRAGVAGSSSSNQHHGTIEWRGEATQSNQTNGGGNRLVPSSWNRSNSSVGSSIYGNGTNSLGNFVPSATLHSRDDDVISLAQSVATWSSRPVCRQNSSTPRYSSGQNDDYDENLRHVVYDRLMKPHV